MRVNQSFLGFLLGVSLLSLPIFFNERFTFNWFVPHFYKILIISGFLTSAYFFAKIIKTKFRYFLYLFLFIEISFYGIFSFLKNGYSFPPALQSHFKDFYMSSMRNAAPYDYKLGQYDNQLFYKFKPGKNRFANLEFNTRFEVNSLGMRDDEKSLKHPRIVCIGDSFTTGWGVENEESFPDLLEQKTNKKTLNMGIPSYGTAREFLFLEKINLDSCELLVIQFCENDLPENRSFIENNYSLNISPEEKFLSAQRYNHMRSSYFPLKWTFEITAKLIRNLFGITHQKAKKSEAQITAVEDKGVSDFFEIIQLIQKRYSGKIVILNLDSYATIDKYYKKFKAHLNENPNEKIVLFDTSKIIDSSDYFPIDDHINAKGHQKVANGIFNLIHRNQALN